MRERCVHVDTIEAAGQAGPGVQTGIEGAVVQRTPLSRGTEARCHALALVSVVV